MEVIDTAGAANEGAGRPGNNQGDEKKKDGGGGPHQTGGDARYPPRDLFFRVVTLALCICCFITALDIIILSSALPAIAANLNATTANAYWCSSAFIFAQSVVQLVYAALSSALDRRTCMLAALTIFTIASVLCATARSVEWLIAARTVGPRRSCPLLSCAWTEHWAASGSR
jgi:MFS family permease